MTTHPKTLVVELLSDATFGSGGGTAGTVDVEVDHDRHGLPLLGGKALRGLVRDSWLSMQEHFADLRTAGHRVLGPHGDLDETAILRIGDAVVDKPARDYFVSAVERQNYPLAPAMVLAALTEIRSQTSEDRKTGGPAQTTLRSTRVVLRSLKLVSPLTWLAVPDARDIQCLALAVLGTRHGGLARNRGRGHLRISIDGNAEQTTKLARGES
jgi:hypothetical protein